ncbi:hypothetical protein FSARC_13933 [Fusarium sarcochroum]|uniref:Uncharacterized protein n=1 Tax=Fusarium sarcochroum TaxID=1208366 RepID=A0A8H4SXV6_9HYPO|nr:hypothetical protein FSARC_13933 [Fusarium sarcochroum]
MERNPKLSQVNENFDPPRSADPAEIILSSRRFPPVSVSLDDQELLVEGKDPSDSVVPWISDDWEPDSFLLNCLDCPLAQIDKLPSQKSLLQEDFEADVENHFPSTAEVDLNSFDPLSDYLGDIKGVPLDNNMVTSHEPAFEESTSATGVTFTENISASGDANPNSMATESATKSQSPDKGYAYQEIILITRGDALYSLLLGNP